MTRQTIEQQVRAEMECWKGISEYRTRMADSVEIKHVSNDLLERVILRNPANDRSAWITRIQGNRKWAVHFAYRADADEGKRYDERFSRAKAIEVAVDFVC